MQAYVLLKIPHLSSTVYAKYCIFNYLVITYVGGSGMGKRKVGNIAKSPGGGQQSLMNYLTGAVGAIENQIRDPDTRIGWWQGS